LIVSRNTVKVAEGKSRQKRRVAMSRLVFGSVIALAGLLNGPPALAQQTTVYAYDVHGRLTTSGVNGASTNFYLYDTANNRSFKRCCESIGGWQVQADGFDPYFYLQTYPDILAAGIDPYQHWLTFGHAENRWPNRYFNTAWYKSTYGIGSGVNPLTEYHTTGWTLGRNPSPEFSTAAYQSAYPDIASVDPLQHYLRWGYGEGRLAFHV
jgi:hypothetical protein